MFQILKEMAEPTDEWKPANECDNKLDINEAVNHSYEENEEIIDGFQLHEKPSENVRIETALKSNNSAKGSPFFNTNIPG